MISDVLDKVFLMHASIFLNHKITEKLKSKCCQRQILIYRGVEVKDAFQVPFYYCKLQKVSINKIHKIEDKLIFHCLTSLNPISIIIVR